MSNIQLLDHDSLNESTNIPRRESRARQLNSCVESALEYYSNLISYLISILPSRQQIVGYSAGCLFSIGWWIFIDSLSVVQKHAGLDFCPTVYNTTAPCYRYPNPQLCIDNKCLIEYPRFEDWVPGIFSTISLIIVNLIDKEALNADEFSYSGGSNTATVARAIAFIGSTMALGSIGGALAILSIKFIIPDKIGLAFYLGPAIVLNDDVVWEKLGKFWRSKNLKHV